MPGPNCVDWDDLPAAELQRRWLALGEWVSKQLMGQLRYPVLWCWPHHPVVVDELKALHCWYQEIMKAQSGAPQELLRFHDSVRRVMRDWPKPCPKETAGTAAIISKRLLEADAQFTAQLLRDVAHEQYMQRTRSAR